MKVNLVDLMNRDRKQAKKQLAEELKKYPRTKLWLMRDLRRNRLELRLKRLELAIDIERNESPDEYEDAVTLDDVLHKLEEFGGPIGCIYQAVSIVDRKPDGKRMGVYISWHGDDRPHKWKYSIRGQLIEERVKPLTAKGLKRRYTSENGEAVVSHSASHSRGTAPRLRRSRGRTFRLAA